MATGSLSFYGTATTVRARDVKNGGGRGRIGVRIATALMIIVASSVTFATADARLGGGSSFGSRGSRTFSMPSATPTAPRMSPFESTQTPRPGAINNGFAGASRPGFFGGGFGRGLLGGFLGAGLFGMLFGGGFGGGLGGGSSLIGLILQLGLLYLAFRFIMGFFRNRQTAGAPSMAGATSQGGTGSSMLGGLFGGGNSSAAPQTTPITIGPDDYQAFERRLQESQAAYSNGDIGALRRVATSEMAGNFEQELAANDRQGVVNRISDVHLVSGDLSEAWREANADYATVAMRFSLVDVTLEKQSNRVVDGNATTPQQVTEVWTFVRPAGSQAGSWLLSGIQQAA